MAKTKTPNIHDIEDALLHSEAESESCTCCHGTFCEQHDGPVVDAVHRQLVSTTTRIEKLISESEQLQAQLIKVVGRPSSHVHSRIKALKDALVEVTGLREDERIPFKEITDEEAVS